MHHRLPLVIVSSLLIAACGQSGQTPPDQGTAVVSSTATPDHHAQAEAATAPHTGTPSADTKRFRSVRLGFYIDYAQDMASSVRFDSHYLTNDNWKVYAKPKSPGFPVLMLTLPDSNEVTAAELRIGISSDDKQVRQCTQPGNAAQPSDQGTADINGTKFTTWHAHDAGMSHYLKVHSYRAVHGHYCYAIDLVVTGTNPEVYQPPKTPPFSQKEAFAKLQQALQGFHFTR